MGRFFLIITLFLLFSGCRQNTQALKGEEAVLQIEKELAEEKKIDKEIEEIEKQVFYEPEVPRIEKIEIPEIEEVKPVTLEKVTIPKLEKEGLEK